MSTHSDTDIACFTSTSPSITFQFCCKCSTIIMDHHLNRCHRCGSDALEHLGLVEIARRLRMQLHGRSIRAIQSRPSHL